MDAFMDDDYDPLAPVYVEDEADEDEADTAGASDADRLVRVWFEDGQLTRVRVSNAWRRKLGSKRLEDCFGAAFAVARVRPAGAGREPRAVDLGSVDLGGLPQFGREPFATFRLAFDNLSRRWQEAASAQRTTPAQPLPHVKGEVEGVVVHLNDDGQVTSVDFDEDWLEDASPREIADGVEDAARKAQAAFTPAEAPHDELAELAREHEALMAGFLTMLNGRR